MAVKYHVMRVTGSLCSQMARKVDKLLKVWRTTLHLEFPR